MPGFKFRVPSSGAVRNKLRWLALRVAAGDVFAQLPLSTVIESGVEVRCALPGRVTIGEGVRLGRDVLLEVGGNGSLSIGPHAWLSRGTVVSTHSAVTVGEYAMVGEYTSIRDFNHGMERDGVPMQRQSVHARPVVIGRDVWIGRGVAILAGVSIGDGAVVGANAVVTKDLPPFVVAVGAPARVVRMRGPS